MDTKQGKSAIDVINGLQDLPPAYYRMVVDALRDAVGCDLCGGNDHNADECKRFAGEREAFEAAVEVVNERGWASSTDLARQIWQLARTAQPAPVVPEGYRLVPVEATTEMVRAAVREADRQESLFGYDGSAFWRAMLAAAPAQGQQVECQECEVLRDQRAAWIRQAAELGSALDAAQAELAALKALHSGEHGMPSDGWPTYHKRKMETLRDLITARYERQIAALKAQQAEQKPVHWLAVLCPEQVPNQLNYHEHVAGFRDRARAEQWIAARRDFDGWRYNLQPLYPAPQPAPAQDVAELLREIIETVGPTVITRRQYLEQGDGCTKVMEELKGPEWLDKAGKLLGIDAFRAAHEKQRGEVKS